MWRAFASERLTAVLVGLLGLSAIFALSVPQGQEALEVARSPHALWMRDLAVWGLDEVFASAWVKALGVLLLGNLVAVGLSNFFKAADALETAVAPERTELREVLHASHPEDSVEVARACLSELIGPPALESGLKARATMLFSPGAGVGAARSLVHLGVLFVIVAAGLEASSGAAKVPRSRLLVTNPDTGTVGHFDVLAGEERSFFERRSIYRVVGYSRDRVGQGPAVQIERRLPDAPRGGAFWIYRDAPAGFDAAHRKGSFAIEAEWVGLSALPGTGLFGSRQGALLILGLGLLFLGFAVDRSVAGKLWVEAEGDTVILSGDASRGGDRAFQEAFGSWVAMTDHALNARRRDR